MVNRRFGHQERAAYDPSLRQQGAPSKRVGVSPSKSDAEASESV